MWKSIGKIKKSEKEISEHLYEGEKKLNQSYGHETMEAERAKTGGTHRERPVQRTRKQEKRGGGLRLTGIENCWDSRSKQRYPQSSVWSRESAGWKKGLTPPNLSSDLSTCTLIHKDTCKHIITKCKKLKYIICLSFHSSISHVLLL